MASANQLELDLGGLQELEHQPVPRPDQPTVLYQARPTTLTCWLCRVELLVPAQGRAVKCSECGAITAVLPRAKASSKLGALCCGWSACTYVPVAFCLGAFAFVVGLGVGLVLPLMYPDGGLVAACHYAMAAVLGVNTTWNYLAAVFAEPEDTTTTTREDVLQRDRSAWENYRWCSVCEAPKPPRAHHCSTCNRCVPGMDHHCGYLGKCVGRHNHAHFLRFLAWLWLSTLYVSVMCSVAIFRHGSFAAWDLAVANSYSAFQGGGVPFPVPGPRVPHQGMSLRQHLPHSRPALRGGELTADNAASAGQMLAKFFRPHQVQDVLLRAILESDELISQTAVIFELMIGVVVTGTILLLGQSQLWYVRHGTTYMEHQFDGPAYAAQFDRGTWNNLSAVFGDNHPATWLLPPRLQYRVPKAKKTR